ncbi:MAG: hypothetical protein AAGF90_11685 [Pseudomonadota bacterium]
MEQVLNAILAFDAPVPDAIWGGVLIVVVISLVIALARARSAVSPQRDELLFREQRRIARHAKATETKLDRERAENRRLKRRIRTDGI